MKILKCECCGAALPIPKYDKYIKCEYCGATYEKEQKTTFLDDVSPFTIRLIEPGYIHTFAAEISIPDEQFRYKSKEQMMPYIRHELANKIARYIEEEMTVLEGWDIEHFATKFQAKIKIDTRNFNY